MTSFCTTSFRVWAPLAGNLQLLVDGSLVPMNSEETGYWRGDCPDAGHGTEYAFVLDGGGPLPDPRSPWQPYGVHGRSRVVDHSRFQWSDAGWRPPMLPSAVIYELHIGTFTPEGTFDSAVRRLEYLKQLGITHVELMPVAEFSGSWGWGYDGADLFAPHHAYGGPDGLKRFVDACHAAGLAVLLDVVYNHLGPSGNYLGRFGPYFTTKYHTPWGPAVNLDGAGSSEVRRFLCDNALMWLRDYHFDGLRIDAIHAFIDHSAVPFLEQLAGEVKRLQAHLGRSLVLSAESDLNDPRVVMPTEAGGYGFDAQWSDDFHHALHGVLTGERAGYYQDFGTLGDVGRALENAFVFDGRHSAYRGRPHGRKPEGLPGWRFLGYLQTHDQVGNRATGERSSRLMNVGRLKIGAALVLCSPFIPMLFQGEEFGAATPFQYFTNHEEPELARAVSEGRRREFAAFGWKIADIPDPQDPETFARSKLNWTELEREPHASLLAWHKQLIALRRRTPEFTDGRLDQVEVRFSEGEQWLTFRRGEYVIALNVSQETRIVPLAFSGKLVLASEANCIIHKTSVEMPSDSVVILRAVKNGRDI
jgi:maltooligosyltrehalose trehalohydrolase